MAYFPNSTSYMMYDAERMCSRCVHNGDGDTAPACPILTLHFIWNYEAVGVNKDVTKETVLNILWPRVDGECRNGDCSMFHEGNPVEAANVERDKRKLAEWERLYGKRTA